MGHASRQVHSGAKRRSGKVNLAPKPLFLSVLLGVSLRRFFAVIHGVSCVSSRRVGVVCGLLMVSGVEVLGRLTMMKRAIYNHLARRV